MKLVISIIFYLASFIGLSVTGLLMVSLLQAYPIDYPFTLGPHQPAFTATWTNFMPKIFVISIVTSLSSVLAVLVILYKCASTEAKAYWVLVVASVNFYMTIAFASGTLSGFFMLPKLANGT